jgi:hypothetical protein
MPHHRKDAHRSIFYSLRSWNPETKQQPVPSKLLTVRNIGAAAFHIQSTPKSGAEHDMLYSESLCWRTGSAIPVPTAYKRFSDVLPAGR